MCNVEELIQVLIHSAIQPASATAPRMVNILLCERQRSVGNTNIVNINNKRAAGSRFEDENSGRQTKLYRGE